MKNQFRNTTGIFAVAGAIVCLSGFATQASSVPDLAPALLAAGFKVRPATTAEQRTHLGTSPDNPFKIVNEDGEPYYLYVDTKHERLFVGNRFAYLAYINNIKNNQLRDQGAFVWEVNPSNRALDRTVVFWPVWTGIAEWSLNGTSRQH